MWGEDVKILRVFGQCAKSVRLVGSQRKQRHVGIGDPGRSLLPHKEGSSSRVGWVQLFSS